MRQYSRTYFYKDQPLILIEYNWPDLNKIEILLITFTLIIDNASKSSSFIKLILNLIFLSFYFSTLNSTNDFTTKN